MKRVLKITKISNDCIGVDLNRNCLRNISMLDFVIIQMLLWKFGRYRYIYRYFQYDICWSQNLILNISRYIFYSEPYIEYQMGFGFVVNGVFTNTVLEPSWEKIKSFYLDLMKYTNWMVFNWNWIDIDFWVYREQCFK